MYKLPNTSCNIHLSNILEFPHNLHHLYIHPLLICSLACVPAVISILQVFVSQRSWTSMLLKMICNLHFYVILTLLFCHRTHSSLAVETTLLMRGTISIQTTFQRRCPNPANKHSRCRTLSSMRCRSDPTTPGNSKWAAQTFVAR